MRKSSPSLHFWAAAALAALAAGCASAPPAPAPVADNYGSAAIVDRINRLLREPFSDTQSVDVIYATNRIPTGDVEECGDSAFGTQPTGTTSYGVCRVNVPKRHSVGGFELAETPHSDPHRYYRVLTHVKLDERALKALVASKKPADVLLFIHGFNVKFGEAIIRAAQLAYDLKFQGPVIVYTWPAGSASFMDSALINRTYEANKSNAAVSVGQLSALLKLLASLDVRVHVLVHSMGHQVALPALAKSAPIINKQYIGELILNAPDYPLKEFPEIVLKIEPVAKRVTLYCSYNDNAIAASEVWNKGRRVGACEQIPGVDVINVGEIDAPALGIGGLGHGYYASRPILTDIFQLLVGMPAERRLFVRRGEPNSVENFVLRP